VSHWDLETGADTCAVELQGSFPLPQNPQVHTNREHVLQAMALHNHCLLWAGFLQENSMSQFKSSSHIDARNKLINNILPHQKLG
jgi:hypothetical protein